MGRLGEIWRRIGMLARREKFGSELEEEMRLHREMKEKELIATGVEVEEARYATARAFGNASALEERGREAWGWRWLEDLVRDCGYALRDLRKNPGYVATAMATLVLGIGATTAIFSVVNTVLLRPLPYADPSRLVQIEENHDGATNFSGATLVDLAATPLKTVAEWGAYRPWTFNVSGGAEPEQAEGAMISASLLETLGASPEIGRRFTKDEERQGADLVTILSYGLWQRQFGADPAALGKTFRVNDVPHLIVGVMPAGFSFPDKAQIWTPLAMSEESQRNRRSHLYRVVGRLAPGATQPGADAELRAFADGVSERNPGIDVGLRIVAQNLRERITAPVRPALLVLLGAVGLVLLAACANVANLMLMHNTTRVREFAVRAALGASHGRLLRQCLTESAALGIAGAVGGVVLAQWCVKAIAAFGPADVPRLAQVHVDGVVLAFATVVSLATAMVFGAAPALEVARTDPNSALKEGGRGTLNGRGSRLRGALVVAEIALALVLLAGSGLLINSFVRLSHVWPGFDERGLLTANLFLSPTRYRDEQVAPFFEQLLGRLRGIPGVESAAVVNSLPVSGGAATDFAIEGRPRPPADQEPNADIRVIAGEYFRTMRIPLLRGRWFDGHDTESSARVMAINQTMAERFWPGENPIGQRVTMRDWGPPLTAEVVGVVGDVKSDSLDAAPDNMIYWAERQFPLIFANVVVRTSGDPEQLSASVKSAIRSVDADLPVARMATMEQRLATSVRPRRMQTVVLGVFAALALSMAIVGIYGVMAYAVNGRRREIGIRVALGADRRRVRNLVLAEGMRWTALGVAIGLAGALAIAGVLSSLLYGVGPRDPITLGGAAMVLGLVALAACWIPARRAMRVDPMVALRHE